MGYERLLSTDFRDIRGGRMKVIEFCSVEHLGDQINKWIDENKKFRIVDIKYSTCYSEPKVVGSALIMYKEK